MCTPQTDPQTAIEIECNRTLDPGLPCSYFEIAIQVQPHEEANIRMSSLFLLEGMRAVVRPVAWTVKYTIFAQNMGNDWHAWGECHKAIVSKV